MIEKKKQPPGKLNEMKGWRNEKRKEFFSQTTNIIKSFIGTLTTC
jgi:hypothetical protein